MELSGTLVRDLNNLSLSAKALSLAKELDKNIDMPIIVWINYPGERNVTGRMPYKHNQFMITVKPQDEQKEFDRIVLHHLLRGIHNTRRYNTLIIDNEYLNQNTHAKEFVDFCNHINSFATTEICRLYFNKRGIYTSAKTRRIGFKDIYNRAKTLKKMIIPCNSIYSYIPIFDFALDLSIYAFINTKFRKKIPNVLVTIQSPKIAKQVEDYLGEIVGLLRKNQQAFHEDKMDSSLNFLLNGIISIFNLPNSFHPEKFYCYFENNIPINGIEQLYSFVPEDIEDSLFFIKCVKTINTVLSAIQDGLDIFEHCTTPDFQINIADGPACQAFADGNKTDGYFITITKTLLYRIKEFSERNDLLPDSIANNQKIYGSTLGERLLKCMIYAVVLHEYAHILNGDCDNDNEYSQHEREQRADILSEQLFRKYHCFLYSINPDSKPEEETQRIISNSILEQSTFKFSLSILNVWREELKEENIFYI